MQKKVLVISDNPPLVKEFIAILREKEIDSSRFTFRYSQRNRNFDRNGLENVSLSPIDLKKEASDLIGEFDLIFSLHCKQIFPAELVRKVKCVNIHPGLNPHNRGWYPQVFSIINGKPLGATIHEMDEEVDHGSIIAQTCVKLEAWDTSLSAYEKVLAAEIKLLADNLEKILSGEYEASPSGGEGNYNSRQDFARLCELDMSQTGTLENHLNLLRALSHGNFKNAYFIDKETGRKVFVKVELNAEDAKL